MKIASLLEDQKIEKRISITPEVAKKYIELGFDVNIFENYGKHLGFEDKEYLDFGVKIIKDEKEIINNADIIIQLGLLNDSQVSQLKPNQTIIGTLI